MATNINLIIYIHISYIELCLLEIDGLGPGKTTFRSGNLLVFPGTYRYLALPQMGFGGVNQKELHLVFTNIHLEPLFLELLNHEIISIQPTFQRV